MKTNKIYFLAILISLALTSCADDILQKPFGSDLLTDSIFSSKQKVIGTIAQAYANSLRSGITLDNWDNNREHGLIGTLSHVSDEINAVKFNWEDSWKISRNGMASDDGTGVPISDDGFGFNYTAIRLNYIIIENIDKVSDMTNNEKLQVKAEMKVLTAYRYEEMFKRYGGVPIVTKSLLSTDDIKIPRSSLADVLAYIVRLCDEAVVDLPDNYPDNEKGRITKGVAMAVKAEALIFAARPLFNSVNPNLDLGNNNNLICFGEYKQSRWNDAINAVTDVINWANNNGYYIINTGSPLDDYGTACATPNNSEVLIAYKNQNPTVGNNGNYYDPRGQSGGANGMSFHQLSEYVKADGAEQIWPDNNPVAYSDYSTKIQEMEPRYKASAMGAGIDAWNNPGDISWSFKTIINLPAWNGRGGTEACGRRVKFWYHAGTRTWFEFPIYRLAEFYLDLAEAYNEIGDSKKSTDNLNVIRRRAGLPDINDVDQTILRKKIQREWAVEFYEEGHRYFDMKHWKLADIGTNIIGGPRKNFIFTYKTGDYASDASGYLTYCVDIVFTGYWSPKQFLDPFPIKEINKGYLVQNPGY